MFKEERHAIIVAAVNDRKYVSVADLMLLTGAGESTIRIDLSELASQGKVVRLRGGAQALNTAASSYELSVEAKMDIEVEAKKRIGAYAATLIPEDSTIYIDAGSSTYFLAEAMRTARVKVVTNSLTIARSLKVKGYVVYVIGGEFKLTTDAFIGSMARETLGKFVFDLGFFGTNGIDLQQGFTTPEYEEAMIKQTAMNQSKKPYVLADHTKFGVRTTVSFHPLDGATIITDHIDDDNFKGKGIMEVCK